MHLVTVLSQFISASVGHTVLLALTIIVASFIIEDPTTVSVGMLASAGAIPVGLALPALLFGIISGDITYHFVGRLARTHPRLERFVEHDFLAPVKTWLEERYILTILIARLIPGARMTIYTASGFFRRETKTFLITVVTAGLAWGTLLFFAAFGFDRLTEQWLGSSRWLIALSFLIVLFLVGRFNLRRLRHAKEQKLSNRSRA